MNENDRARERRERESMNIQYLPGQVQFRVCFGYAPSSFVPAYLITNIPCWLKRRRTLGNPEVGFIKENKEVRKIDNEQENEQEKN